MKVINTRPMAVVTVRMPHNLLSRLDEVALRDGTNRPEAMRSAITRYCEHSDEKAIQRREARLAAAQGV